MLEMQRRIDDIWKFFLLQRRITSLREQATLDGLI
jgi:hypothetical protein